jgi:hypothetical protein
MDLERFGIYKNDRLRMLFILSVISAVSYSMIKYVSFSEQFEWVYTLTAWVYICALYFAIPTVLIILLLEFVFRQACVRISETQNYKDNEAMVKQVLKNLEKNGGNDYNRNEKRL